MRVAGRKTRSPGLATLVLLVALLAPGSVAAWNGAGHRLVALIAWNELSRSERLAVDALLLQHPDAWRWTRRAEAGDDPARLRMTEASTWADDIRRDERFYDAGSEPPTPILPGFPDMARHRAWHFVNQAVGPTPPRRPVDGELDRRLPRLAEVVGDPDTVGSHRAYALVWLIHLVGDIHQPLHVATRFAADGSDDAGGNGIAVVDPDNTRRPQTSLHAWWDDLPGPPWLRGSRLAAAALGLRRRHAPIDPGSIGDVARWRDESFALALTLAYEPAGNAVLSADYRQRARQAAEARIVLAGLRLAVLLRELLGDGR